jgi:phosphoribosylformylglycinamidine cyclo-ligase
VGEELMMPTRIYVKPVMEILKNMIKVHGLANITGGAFTKLPRLNANVRYVLDNLPSPTGIFKQIQNDGEIDTREMYRTFNMGIGFCVMASKTYVDDIVHVFKKHRMNCGPVGKIERGHGEVVIKDHSNKYAL